MLSHALDVLDGWGLKTGREQFRVRWVGVVWRGMFFFIRLTVEVSRVSGGAHVWGTGRAWGGG
jgi:hypothetical protein